jgi:hypothetical protein
MDAVIKLKVNFRWFFVFKNKQSIKKSHNLFYNFWKIYSSSGQVANLIREMTINLTLDSNSLYPDHFRLSSKDINNYLEKI